VQEIDRVLGSAPRSYTGPAQQVDRPRQPTSQIPSTAQQPVDQQLFNQPGYGPPGSYGQQFASQWPVHGKPDVSRAGPVAPLDPAAVPSQLTVAMWLWVPVTALTATLGVFGPTVLAIIPFLVGGAAVYGVLAMRRGARWGRLLTTATGGILGLAFVALLVFLLASGVFNATTVIVAAGAVASAVAIRLPFQSAVTAYIERAGASPGRRCGAG
jgi:hypothetical protein